MAVQAAISAARVYVQGHIVLLLKQFLHCSEGHKKAVNSIATAIALLIKTQESNGGLKRSLNTQS